MKKILLFVFALMISVNCFAAGRGGVVNDINGWGSTADGDGISIDADGNILPWTDDDHDLGSSTYQFKDIYIDGVAYIDEPAIDNVITKIDGEYLYQNLAAKTTYSFLAAGVAVTTSTLVAMTTGFDWSGFTQVGNVARNLCCYLDIDPANDETAVTSTHTMTLTWTLTGKGMYGQSLSESLQTVGFGKVALSSQAYASITNIFVTLVSAPSDFGNDADLDSVKLLVGNGDLIGLSGDIDAAADLFKGTVNGVDETSDFTANATYDTWTHSDVPDGSDDFVVWFYSNSN